jgi:S-DNA-T family DNA segregation ATPase FtsK/SpoIIIE
MVKLLRMGKAVGIHLIVGTSRPCEEAYPDSLRANFPARLSFATASQDDLKIILNTEGAEDLLGRGDCLFINKEMSMPVRLQAPFVDEEDIKNAVKYIKDEAGNKKFIDIQASLPPEYDDEELLAEAKDIVIKSGKASASLLQRKLRIGYTRAASLLDSLEELGIVGPQKGSNPREVLVKKE